MINKWEWMLLLRIVITRKEYNKNKDEAGLMDSHRVRGHQLQWWAIWNMVLHPSVK